MTLTMKPLDFLGAPSTSALPPPPSPLLALAEDDEWVLLWRSLYQPPVPFRTFVTNLGASGTSENPTVTVAGLVKLICETDRQLSPRRVKNALVKILPRATAGQSRGSRKKMPSELGPPAAVIDLEWLHQVGIDVHSCEKWPILLL